MGLPDLLAQRAPQDRLDRLDRPESPDHQDRPEPMGQPEPAALQALMD
jgi:hypothetical protein